MKKIDIIKRAFRKLGLTGVSADPGIPQYDDALIDLEYMMAEWDDMPSVNTGYNSTGTSATLDEQSGLSINDMEAVSNNLALRVATDYKIQVDPQIDKLARAGLSSLIKRGATIPRPSYTNRTPRGLGNVTRALYPYLDSFYSTQKSSSDAEQFNKNDVVNYTVDMSGWLTGNTIASAVWSQALDKITITNQAIGTAETSATLTFPNAGVYTINIKVTDNLGQITTETIEFAVNDV